jgi:hypothetical protein
MRIVVAQGMTPAGSGIGAPLRGSETIRVADGARTVVRRFLALPGAERRMLLNALPVLALVRLALWTVPTRPLLQYVLGRAAQPDPRSTAPDPRAVGRAVERAARVIPRATCLPQALTALLLLARHGHSGVLRVGVKRGRHGELLAHAWVECTGRTVIGGHGVRQYAVLPELEDALGLQFR